MKILKCKFCKFVCEFHSTMHEHILNAHETNLFEEIYFDEEFGGDKE